MTDVVAAGQLARYQVWPIPSSPPTQQRGRDLNPRPSGYESDDGVRGGDGGFAKRLVGKDSCDWVDAEFGAQELPPAPFV